MDNPIEVSVTLLCYNHGRYLKKCLDSILMQEVNFTYEIIVGDDCSTDNSREILREYEQRYPNILKVIYNENNLGVSGNSKNIGKYIRASKYISGGESDDYWTDSRRLQKEYDFLEGHPEYSAVGSNYYNVDPDGNNPYIALLRWQVDKKYEMKDYIHYGFIVHGNTLMRRRSIFPLTDPKYLKLKSTAPTMGDIITRVLLYDYGPIYCLPDIMHAHRDGSKDKSSFMNQTKNNKLIYLTKMFLKIVDALEEYFDHKYDLTGLKINRIATTIFQKHFWKCKVDETEYKDFFKTIPFTLLIRAYIRFGQKVFRSFIHVFGRKFKLFKIINEK